MQHLTRIWFHPARISNFCQPDSQWWKDSSGAMCTWHHINLWRALQGTGTVYAENLWRTTPDLCELTQHLSSRGAGTSILHCHELVYRVLTYCLDEPLHLWLFICFFPHFYGAVRHDQLWCISSTSKIKRVPGIYIIKWFMSILSSLKGVTCIQ